MKIDSIFLDTLQCIKSKEGLVYTDINNDFLLKLVEVFYSKFNEQVNGFLISENDQYYYPICDGVIVMFNGYFFDSNANLVGLKEINPFGMHAETNPEWYEKYANIVSFKNIDIIKAVRKSKVSKGILVEYMSSSGQFIRHLHKEFYGLYDCFIAIDADFYALKELGRHDRAICKLCCNATSNVFKEESIAIATSNSVHHIPDFSEKFYKNIDSSLVSEGMFIGVESQGFYAKIVMYIIRFLPSFVIPGVFKEIYLEKDLIRKWLAIPVLKRLQIAGIKSKMIKKKYPFHILYGFVKS